MERKSLAFSIFVYVCALLLAAVILAPLVWLFVMSISPAADLSAKPLRWWPQTADFSRYQLLLSTAANSAGAAFTASLRNSLMVSGMATIAAIALLPLATMAMFPFAGTNPNGPTKDPKTGKDSLTLFHGTSSNRAARIVGSPYYAAEGFKAGRDYFFAEDFVTAEVFGRARLEPDQPPENRPQSFTVISFTMPYNLGWRLGLLHRYPIGGFLDRPFVDVPAGSGFERVLRSEYVVDFNFNLFQSVITSMRFKLD